MIRSLFLALLAVGLLVSPLVSTATTGEVPVGGVIRDQPMQGLNGPSRPLSHYRGRPLVINVWASWCEPCRREMGSLERLARVHARGRFEVIGISTDDYPDKAKSFLNQTRATLSHYIDQRLQLENMLGADRLPLTLLVDIDGTVLDKTYGAQEWDSAANVARIRKAFRLKD